MSTDRWTLISIKDPWSMLVPALIVWIYYRRRTFPPAYRYSTFWPRLWTGNIDGCVLWSISMITSLLLTLNMPRSLAALLMSIPSFVSILYTVVMHARYGQTVGKMVTKVRVVDFRTEGKISVRQAWLREAPLLLLSAYWVFALLSGRSAFLEIASDKEPVVQGSLWILMAIPGLWFAAEILTMLTNAKRRALHDFIAGTVVVRTNAISLPDPIFEPAEAMAE